MESIFGAVFEFIFGGILELPWWGWRSEKKLDRNIASLMEEPWFAALEKDYRYGFIIRNNEELRRYLVKKENVIRLAKHPEEQEMFTMLVKQEHLKFTSLKPL
ncbi:hypothetical protein [Planococcus lenghuensis]|uniref:Uncharacterized protein n=1 Tax=Planococcus lenghuensis TaxID=2213202 RepID=A0A1Q2KVZ5_9BACL|nr:hypothetical protein [Planococcus lenghuensis]AQQ52388.1 hypothetical protein B0X71_04165 [Planococcus lenghuensis]